jgi:hypothetical protein
LSTVINQRYDKVFIHIIYHHIRNPVPVAFHFTVSLRQPFATAQFITKERKRIRAYATVFIKEEGNTQE